MLRLEVLKAELADIERLDQFYWLIRDPERYEKLGYLVRQDRRRELITELLKLIQEGGGTESVSVSCERHSDYQSLD